MKDLLILAAVVSLQFVLVFGQDKPCDDYVDGILRDLKEDKEIFQDPFAIPEKFFQVHKKVLLINYTAEASIHDGFIFGMASLHRDGEVIVDRKKNTHLKIYLGAGELKMQCSGKIKMMGHGPQAKIDAKVSYVSMKLDIVPTTKGSNPKISNFKIEEVKGMEVKASGLGPLNFIMNSYIKMLGTVFKGLIRSGIESRLQVFMEKKIKQYEIPEECLKEGMKRSLKF